ncbi:TPA: ATP citrate synthase [Candidatus Woesearchaeota archaeon]|nr:ATP citrate synthase [Candidatus Woesearchaeota archaeon]
MNEFFNILSRATNGVYEGVAIGGDQFPGSTLLDHLLRYEHNPNIKLLVALGEIGGNAEYDIIEAVKQGKITKPLVMWVSGTSASLFPWQVQFGHAGAKAGKEAESAQAKNQALRDTGIIVPHSFEEFETTVGQVYKKLIENKTIMEHPESKAPVLNENRTKTHFTNTISSDLGEEPTYNGVRLSELVSQHASVGKVIGHLWFKKDVPDYFAQFIDLCIVLTADHGPAVSGAHNAIVASRAGKDVISSLASGLLTIGPRFGGATDAAAQYFKQACDDGKEPAAFVKEMKQKGIRIPGIGHRVKSKKNPDKRVEILIKFARDNFPSHTYLDYALEVEKITLEKAENLILNVDGCMAALFLDALSSQELFSKEEQAQIVSIGYMNGLFALARSVGMIGHILDQKRLGEGLYRHPVDDILYTN